MAAMVAREVKSQEKRNQARDETVDKDELELQRISKATFKVIILIKI